MSTGSRAPLRTRNFERELRVPAFSVRTVIVPVYLPGLAFGGRLDRQPESSRQAGGNGRDASGHDQPRRDRVDGPFRRDAADAIGHITEVDRRCRESLPAGPVKSPAVTRNGTQVAQGIRAPSVTGSYSPANASPCNRSVKLLLGAVDRCTRHPASGRAQRRRNRGIDPRPSAGGHRRSESARLA